MDRVKIDRVLQYCPEPQLVLVELARVLRPGGICAAYDNDWSTFQIQVGQKDLSRQIAASWISSFKQPNIGAQLEKLFTAAGFKALQIVNFTSTTNSFEEAVALYDVERVAKAVSLQRPARAEEILEWLGNLRNSPVRPVTSLPTSLVVGIKQ